MQNVTLTNHVSVLQCFGLDLSALCTVYTVERLRQKDVRAQLLTVGIDCLSNQVQILTGMSHATNHQHFDNLKNYCFSACGRSL